MGVVKAKGDRASKLGGGGGGVSGERESDLC